MTCANCGKDRDIRPQIEGIGICFECANNGRIKVNVEKWKKLREVRD